MEEKIEMVKTLINNGYVNIITGFSGIGKSTVADGITILDFESSPYSHYENGDPNPTFPENYITELINLILYRYNKYKYKMTYLLSCHESVRNKLAELGLMYIIVRPLVTCQNEYVKRWLRRGSSIPFITSMSRKWDIMLRSCYSDDATSICLNEGEYLSDILRKNSD